MPAATVQEPKRLRFLSRGTALVPNYESAKSGVRRFHGWKHHTEIGIDAPVVEDDGRPETDAKGKPTGRTVRLGGFVKQLGQVTAVGIHSEFAGEYIRHLRDGDLWAADEFTARTARVKFDASFGGEHDDDARDRLALEMLQAQAISAGESAGAVIEVEST